MRTVIDMNNKNGDKEQICNIYNYSDSLEIVLSDRKQTKIIISMDDMKRLGLINRKDNATT